MEQNSKEWFGEQMRSQGEAYKKLFAEQEAQKQEQGLLIKTEEEYKTYLKEFVKLQNVLRNYGPSGDELDRVEILQVAVEAYEKENGIVPVFSKESF